MRGDMDLVPVGVGETKLKSAKKAGAPRDGRPHEMELAKEALP